MDGWLNRAELDTEIYIPHSQYTSLGYILYYIPYQIDYYIYIYIYALLHVVMDSQTHVLDSMSDTLLDTLLYCNTLHNKASHMVSHTLYNMLYYVASKGYPYNSIHGDYWGHLIQSSNPYIYMYIYTYCRVSNVIQQVSHSYLIPSIHPVSMHTSIHPSSGGTDPIRLSAKTYAYIHTYGCTYVHGQMD